MGDVNWIHMNLRFHKRREIHWRDEWLLASQEGLCSMEMLGWLVGWLVSYLVS